MGEADEKLMLSVRDGDVSKLGVLFDRHHRALFDFFARMTGSRTAAEDLVQDVFFRILKYRTTYRHEGSFTTWMFHIARNARSDYYRKQRNDIPIAPEEMDLPGTSPFPGRELEERQQVRLLESALLKLPAEKREVLVLSRYGEMKYEEIARLLGCEVGAVKVRVHRALKDLREIFFKLSGEKRLCDVKKSANALRIT